MSTNTNASWKNTQTAKQYLQTIQRFYEREPAVQISVQLLLSIFAVAFFTFAAIRPTLSTVSTLLKKIEDQKDVNNRLDIKIQQLSMAQAELNKWQAEIPLISQAVPDNDDLVGFVRRLEVLANQSNVHISSIEFQPYPVIGTKTSLTEEAKNRRTAADKTDSGTFITFTFMLKGDANQILSFVNRMEQMDRVIMITKLGITKPENVANNEPPLTATGRGTLYYLPNTKK